MALPQPLLMPALFSFHRLSFFKNITILKMAGAPIEAALILMK